jgi:two-component system, LytTR family, response regulator
MIKAIIIEDEKHSRDILDNMLQQHFKQVEVMAVCKNAEEGKTAIENLHPELVFTDIELEKKQVFEMLQQLGNIDFEIVFTTAHQEYAIQAIRFSAIDYLLKPFGLEDLSAAIKRFEQKKDKQQSSGQLDLLFHNLKHIQKDAKKIALPTSNGLTVVPLKDIIRCEAEVNYTNFFLTTKHKMVVTKTLKEYEELLNDYDFIRVHNSHLINLHHIKNYVRGEGGIVTMTDGTSVDVSRRKKEEFLKRLAEL